MELFELIGKVIMAWLLLGFVAGLRIVYTEQLINELIEETEEDAIKREKRIMLVVLTMMGVFTFLVDTITTFIGTETKEK